MGEKAIYNIPSRNLAGVNTDEKNLAGVNTGEMAIFSPFSTTCSSTWSCRTKRASSHLPLLMMPTSICEVAEVAQRVEVS